jgi:hypothetical protein
LALQTRRDLFGLSAFREFCIEETKNDVDNFRYYDFFYQHKRLMFDRICLLSDRFAIPGFTDRYYALLEKSVVIRSLALKNRVKRISGITDTKTKNTLIQNTIAFLDVEEAILTDFVNLLEIHLR